jgi:hypothetical protein
MLNAPEGALAQTGQVDTSVPRSPLRQALDTAIAEANGRKLSMKDLTVLAVQNDPFRLDTPARHRDGEWLAITARELGLGSRKIHLRGLHYMLIGRPKPDGTPYTNTEADWLWLSGDCGKASRWLGYLPFDQVVDQRNAEPITRIFEPPGDPWPYVHVGIRVEIPEYLDLEPRVGLYPFRGVQPYKLVMIGEKSSLDAVLAPIAAAYEADLYLPTGEPSDTQIYQMAKIGADDGRPMVVSYFSDADPSGWQMPLSVGRKLQAFKTSLFPELDFQVQRVALTPDQVREYGLPSTPLKDTEKRADAWQAAMGVEQTEIDALASLQPDLLRRSPATRSPRSMTRRSTGGPTTLAAVGLSRRRPSSTSASTPNRWNDYGPRRPRSSPSSAPRSTRSTMRCVSTPETSTSRQCRPCPRPSSTEAMVCLYSTRAGRSPSSAGRSSSPRHTAMAARHDVDEAVQRLRGTPGAALGPARNAPAAHRGTDLVEHPRPKRPHPDARAHPDHRRARTG